MRSLIAVTAAAALLGGSSDADGLKEGHPLRVPAPTTTPPGVGVVMTLARRLERARPRYDVWLVATGPRSGCTRARPITLARSPSCDACAPAGFAGGCA
ncbi:MAG: hypothetical protein ACR2F4_02495, partial [Thermoleophilaceae bacterium]